MRYSERLSKYVPGVGLLNLSEMLGKMGGGRTKTVKLAVRDAVAPLIAEEGDKLLDQDSLTKEALILAENEGIVFLDEIDKVAARQGASGADVSREGVQRDLLPLIEGTTVSTKYGPVKTDHVLFIASGAFHVAKPSDLLPELQGRLPIRVELKALTRDDFKRILTEPEANLIRQNQALLATEDVTLTFTEDAIEALADAAVAANSAVENIGARRLQTVLERVLEETSFKASDLAGWRNEQVFIQGALHVPLSKEAVRECMPVFFELLADEPHAAVRAVLGHFFFVYIHPYMDGNGRLARFIFNAMLTTGGYEWTIVPLEQRQTYMEALERASSYGEIQPLARFFANLLRQQRTAPLPRPQ